MAKTALDTLKLTQRLCPPNGSTELELYGQGHFPAAATRTFRQTEGFGTHRTDQKLSYANPRSYPRRLVSKQSGGDPR